MKKTKKTVLSLVLALLIVSTVTMNVVGSPNDTVGYWAKGIVNQMLDDSVLRGYGDSSLKLDNNITRAEFVTFINRYFGFTSEAAIDFTDVQENDWFYMEVAKAIAAGYISSYDDNTFRPVDTISRQEAVVILSKVGKLDLSDEKNNLTGFSDANAVDSSAFNAVNTFVGLGILNGYIDKTLKPEKMITRVEALVLLYRFKNTEKPMLPVIQSIHLYNGMIRVITDKPVKGFSLEDVIITATLNDQPYLLADLEYYPTDGLIRFLSIHSLSTAQTLSVKLDAAGGSAKLTGSASWNLAIPIQDFRPNTAPSTPVITKSPAGNVTELTDVTITAESTDDEGDAITYVWTGRLAETSRYPVGRQVITVKAVDEHGLESDSAAIVFFVVDSATGSGGLLLTDPESRIYENGIDGATIIHYTFNVPSVSGHWGSDYAFVNGLNVNTQLWEQIIYSATSNGIYFEGDLTPGTYIRLEFFYYASHCMYGKSNITYSVDFQFGTMPVGAPAESAPEAQNVAISGATTVGSILTGSYTYFDANGDLQGVSTYQWYRADDAIGTNKAAIAGATGLSYTIAIEDTNKFITIEVTPVAVTGITGTITGSAAGSTPLAIPTP